MSLLTTSRRVLSLPIPLRLLIAGLLLFAIAATGRPAPIVADEGCDANEPIACIPLPAESPAAPSGPLAPSSNAAGAPASVALPAPGGFCPASSCCPSYAGSSAVIPQSPAVVAPVYPCCSPYPSGVAGSNATISAPALPAPVPPYPCPSYRGIYTTINLGNAADARALRTLSSDGLSAYWRGSALSQLRSQLADLRLRGVYASVRLYSIQVQDSNFRSSGSATVHTMEHWLYEERWLDDRTIVVSQDQWVANEYNLTFTGGAWYITDNTATLVGGPVPYPGLGG